MIKGLAQNQARTVELCSEPQPHFGSGSNDIVLQEKAFMRSIAPRKQNILSRCPHIVREDPQGIPRCPLEVDISWFN